MKKIIGYILPLVMLAGCDSYLDRQPDDALTPDMLFQKRETALKYLATVYSQQPNESNASCNNRNLPWHGCSDDATIQFINYDVAKMTHDTWNSGTNAYMATTYTNMYRGIREATYFMQNIYKCPESEMLRADADRCYNEARFMRAYYYFLLMKVYGPVFLLGDDLAALDSGDRERNTWDECVEYVEKELWEAAQGLPLEWENVGSDWGRATKGAALAVRAKLLLYSASPLFNGNPMYAGLMTSDGKHIFPQTADPEKWKLAADAAREVIDLNHYDLVDDATDSDKTLRAINNMKKVFTTLQNEELIWFRLTEGASYRRVVTPSGSINNIKEQGWGGLSATQKLVDAFAMDNGRYPITGYNADGSPVVDPEVAGYYSEEGFSDWTHPYFGDKQSTYRMYQNREPRFYLNIMWSGRKWYHANKADGPIQLYLGGRDYLGQNHPETGYLPYKFSDRNLDLTTGYGNLAWPYIRYADVLLMYAEAMNEYDPADPEILTCLNKVRTRAGVSEIARNGVYPDWIGNQAKMRELIHRERQVELCFENQRYFDVRRWMKAKEEFAGPVYGMNTYASSDSANSSYWERVVIKSDGGLDGNRRFSDRCYFFPIPYDEAIIVKGFTQNYGW